MDKEEERGQIKIFAINENKIMSEKRKEHKFWK